MLDNFVLVFSYQTLKSIIVLINIDIIGKIIHLCFPKPMYNLPNNFFPYCHIDILAQLDIRPLPYLQGTYIWVGVLFGFYSGGYYQGFYCML